MLKQLQVRRTIWVFLNVGYDRKKHLLQDFAKDFRVLGKEMVSNAENHPRMDEQLHTA